MVMSTSTPMLKAVLLGVMLVVRTRPFQQLILQGRQLPLRFDHLPLQIHRLEDCGIS